MAEPAALASRSSRNGGPAWGASVAAVAMACPDATLSNAEVAARLGVDEHWIERRTGVRERRISDGTETLVELSARAATATLEAAGCAPEEVDMVIVATMTPDRITPNAAPMVAAQLGLERAAAFDVGAACTGWLSGIAVGAAQVETGRAERVLVIGADMMSRVTDRDDRATALLFADGAGAVLVRRCAGSSRIGPVVLGTEPAGVEWITASHEEGVVRMVGPATYRAAVDCLVRATTEATESVGLGIEDIDVFAFHQGNGRILRSVGERLDLPEEKVLVAVDRFGNTSAASIPIALADAQRSGRLRPGQRVLLASFGAGITWGAAVVEWEGGD